MRRNKQTNKQHLLISELSRASCSVIGPGGLAAEAPGGEAEGGDWQRGAGAEEEAVRRLWRLRSCSAEEPALEAAARTGSSFTWST